MTLIEQYLVDVGRRIPARVRSGVTKELRAAIDDAVEARTHGSSRAATEADVEAALLELGSPEAVAAAYNPSGQYLIGPELYPVFIRALRVTMLALLILATLGFLTDTMRASIAGNLGDDLLGWTGWAIRTAILAGVVIVSIFALIQKSGAAAPALSKKPWHPRLLPPIEARDLVSRGECVFGLVIAGVTMVIAYDIVGAFRTELPSNIQPLISRLMDRNYALLNVALITSVLMNALLLAQGSWRAHTRVLHAISSIIGLYVCCNVAITLVGARSEMAQMGLNRRLIAWLTWSAVITAVVAAAALVAAYAKRYRGRSPFPPAHTGSASPAQ